MLFLIYHPMGLHPQPLPQRMTKVEHLVNLIVMVRNNPSHPTGKNNKYNGSTIVWDLDQHPCPPVKY